jgi:hypothetical protein
MGNRITRPLFPLGQVVATPGAISRMEQLGIEPIDLLRRHVTGDWGDIHPDDRGLNELALADGSRIFSVYGKDDECIWLISDAVGDDGQRTATTFLLPEDY